MTVMMIFYIVLTKHIAEKNYRWLAVDYGFARWDVTSSSLTQMQYNNGYTLAIDYGTHMCTINFIFIIDE